MRGCSRRHCGWDHRSTSRRQRRRERHRRMTTSRTARGIYGSGKWVEPLVAVLLRNCERVAGGEKEADLVTRRGPAGRRAYENFGGRGGYQIFHRFAEIGFAEDYSCESVFGFRAARGCNHNIFRTYKNGNIGAGGKRLEKDAGDVAGRCAYACRL